MQRGDRLIAVDGHPVTGLSHSDVIQLMSHAARIGHVSLTLRRETMENGLDIHNGSDKQTEFADGADMRRYHSNSTCKWILYQHRSFVFKISMLFSQVFGNIRSFQ